jgi:hypothetical protein
MTPMELLEGPYDASFGIHFHRRERDRSDVEPEDMGVRR